MINRWITEKLKETIRRFPAVALLGPRQVGKTTLALTLGKARNSIYLDLEAPDDLVKLQDPLSFLPLHSDKLIILDEIQRAPNLFMTLRGLIDKNRRANRQGEQFLLLGSASMDLLHQSSESLAGRISYMELGGFNILETQHNRSQDLHRLWLRGGLPNSYLASSDSAGMEWLEMLIRTYLERDVPQMGFRVPASRLRRLWTMLAHLQGETLNYQKLGGNLEVDGKTIRHYLDILVDLLLVRRLHPWYWNVKKRLVKSPRFYIRDSGILHRLLGISDFDDLLSNPVLGKSWEGFVIDNILSVLPIHIEPYFYRTAAGAEIDLVLKLSSRELWALDIKHGLVPQVKSGFHQAAKDINATKKFVVYGGDDEFTIKNETTVISLPGLMARLERVPG